VTGSYAWALHWIAVAVTAILSTARLTRLVVFDGYPPMAWARNRWRVVTRDGEWSKLVDCGYCAAPYLAAGVLAWGHWTSWNFWWWAVNGWLAVSYLAAIVVARDGDD
jgi:hypothetical protein